MSDDLVKRLRSKIITHTDAAVWMLEAAGRIEELEAKLAKAESFVRDVAYRATTVEHDQDEMWLLDFGALRHERDCDITQARTTLAELSKERSDEKGQDDE